MMSLLIKAYWIVRLVLHGQANLKSIICFNDSFLLKLETNQSMQLDIFQIILFRSFWSLYIF